MMPVLFIGHGSPMNAIAVNEYSKTLNRLGTELPKPKAILVVSAHWLTQGTFVTSTDTPKLIYDFFGFPHELFEAKYPARGSQAAALKINHLIENTRIQFDNGSWGLDHGSWSVLRHLYPQADIPVLQLSIDMSKPIDWHLNFAKELVRLRDDGFLIVGSGNIVHNLRNFSWRENVDVFPWASEFDKWFKQKLEERDFNSLITDFNKTEAGKLSVPALDHYLPAVYGFGASLPSDKLSHVYEEIQNGSIAMRSFMFS
jgi:4,5-DOPA dioxygenase extradiol